MAEVTNGLIYEVFKTMQTRLSNTEGSLVELKTELRAINAEVRLGRIEKRLELTEAPVL
jgi:hypothetical protein